MADPRIIGNFKSFADFQEEAQKNNIAQALTMAKLANVGSGGSVPAPMQIANKMFEYSKIAQDPSADPATRAEAEARYNLLGQAAKTYGFDRGFQYDFGTGNPAPGNTPPMATSLGADGVPLPALPKAPPMTNPQAANAVIDLFGAGNATGQNGAPLPSMRQTLANAPAPTSNVSVVPGFSQAAASMAADKKRAETQAQKDVELRMNPPIEKETKRSGEVGKALGETEGGIGKKAINAPVIVSILDEIEKPDEKGLSLLDKATGGDIEAGGARFNKFIGRSTDATKANSELGMYGNLLVNFVPRMEGPQSNYDLEFYKAQAGRIADPSVPPGDKKAAIAAIRGLQYKYEQMGQNIFEGMPSAPAPATKKSIDPRRAAFEAKKNPPKTRLKYNPATGDFE